MGNPGKTIVDDQTGQVFQVVDERWFDVLSAWISAAYSLIAIGYLAYVVLDTWSGQFKLWPASLTSQLDHTISGVVFKLIVYTAAGGGMGAAVNNLRSFVSWHAERKAFGWRFVWKYIALPPLGATLAVLVYGIIQGGMAVFNGGNVSGTAVTSLSAWATGTLAGYGSHKVFIWLDDKVNSFFKVDEKKTQVPDVTGKTVDEAKKAFADANLRLGETTDQATTEPAQVGKVIAHDPPAGTDVACGSKINVTVGVPSDKGATVVDEAKKNGQPVVPAVEPAVVGNGEQPNPQNPAPGAPGALPADVEAAVEGAAAGVINPPDVNNPQNGGGGQG